MPTSSSGGGPVNGRQLPGDGLQRVSQLFRRDGLVEVELLGQPHGAEIEAELAVHASPVAEGELGATAAGVEDDQIGIGQAEPRLHRQVGDPALVLAADHLDRDAAIVA